MKRNDRKFREQPSLFDFAESSTATQEPRLSRVSDPATSKDAEPLTSNRRFLCGVYLDEVYKSAEPLTAGEIAAKAAALHPGVIAESVRKRTAELVESGEIVVAGERRCSISGKNCRTFRAKGSS